LRRRPPQYYVFQGKVYRHRFSDYLEFVNAIEEQLGISDELRNEIAAFQWKKTRYDLSCGENIGSYNVYHWELFVDDYERLRIIAGINCATFIYPRFDA
jgi:hypothetical protein